MADGVVPAALDAGTPTNEARPASGIDNVRVAAVRRAFSAWPSRVESAASRPGPVKGLLLGEQAYPGAAAGDEAHWRLIANASKPPA